MASGKIISFTNIRLPRPSFRFTNDMRPTNSEYVDKNATFKKFVLQFLSLFQYCGRLTFCNISVFKAGCIYQLRVVQVQDDLEEARRPRKRCGATVAVCVEEGGCVCVSLLSSWNPPKCELRPRLEISTSRCQVEPLALCSFQPASQSTLSTQLYSWVQSG